MYVWQFLLIRTTAFEKAAVVPGQAAPIESVPWSTADDKPSQFISESQSTSERPDLTTARVVVSGQLREIKSRDDVSAFHYAYIHT